MIATSTIEQIKKRDGRIVPFDRQKITTAILKAAQTVQGTNAQEAEALTDAVINHMNDTTFPTVEQIQDTIEQVLIQQGHSRIAKAFILYRARRSRIREGKSELLDTVAEIMKSINHESANIANSPSAKLLQIGAAASKEFYLKRMIPERVADAHIRGEIHIHDLEHYTKSPNSFVIPLSKLLKEGFQAGYGFIRPPKRARSIGALANVILQSAQSDSFGAQCFAQFDTDIANILKDTEGDLYQAIEGLIYDLNTIYSRVGMQVPFSSLNLGLDTSEAGRMVTRCVLKAIQSGLGLGETPIFPNVTFMLKRGVNLNPEDPNYDLFQMALETAQKRLMPTFALLDASFNADNPTYFSGCNRIPASAEGRGNVASVTINLPRLALKAHRDPENFFKNLDRTLELAVFQLTNRLELLGQLKAKDLPFIMGQKLYEGSEELKPNDSIHLALSQGTLSVGFIGLAETLVALTGKHHGEALASLELGKQILERMRNYVDQASQEQHLNFGLYASQADSISGRLVALDRQEFGEQKGVTDKSYYSNSFHLPPNFQTDTKTKMLREAPFHQLCNHGHITVIDLAEAQSKDLETLIHQALDAECGQVAFNLPNDHCLNCGWIGKADEKCPTCQSQNLRYVRRLSGYLAPLDRFTEAKREELGDRLPQSLFVE